MGSNNGPDADRAIIPASTFATMFVYRYVHQILVRPRDITRVGEVKEQIYGVLGRRHKFDPSDERALSIWDFVEQAKLINQIGLGIQIFLGIVASWSGRFRIEASVGPQTLRTSRSLSRSHIF